MKVLNLLIEGLALSGSVKWRRLQFHGLGLSPNSIDHCWNCLAQRRARGFGSLSIFRKQVIEQDHGGRDLIDFALARVVGTLSACD
jgi:hypothetical protein